MPAAATFQTSNICKTQISHIGDETQRHTDLCCDHYLSKQEELIIKLIPHSKEQKPLHSHSLLNRMVNVGPSRTVELQTLSSVTIGQVRADGNQTSLTSLCARFILRMRHLSVNNSIKKLHRFMAHLSVLISSPDNVNKMFIIP